MNYKLYCDILALGKRLYCCAGGDGHACCSDKAMTTIYSAERKNASYIQHLREGDFVCGPIGIKMCIGDTRMGIPSPKKSRERFHPLDSRHIGQIFGIITIT